jgi:hypothetical protein
MVAAATVISAALRSDRRLQGTRVIGVAMGSSVVPVESSRPGRDHSTMKAIARAVFQIQNGLIKIVLGQTDCDRTANREQDTQCGRVQPR